MKYSTGKGSESRVEKVVGELQPAKSVGVGQVRGQNSSAWDLTGPVVVVRDAAAGAQQDRWLDSTAQEQVAGARY